MDNRITKTRLGNLLSYDWLKIIAIIIAIALVWSLAFTTGAPRASVGQTFGLFTYAPDFEKAKDEGTLLSEAKADGAFSYDILDFNVRSMQKDYYATIMTAANSVQEGDIFVTSDFAETQEKNQSPFRSFVDGYGSVVYDLDALVSDAKSYALSNGIVQKDGEYTVDDAVVASKFAERMKKDPRFRNTQSQKYADGLKSEKERMISVWNNAVILENVLKNHPELRVNYRMFDQTINAIDEADREKSDYYKYWQEETEKTYAINLGKLTGGKEGITSLYSRQIEVEGEDPVVSADGVVLCVFNYKEFQPDLQYETLGYINYMIKKYSDFADFTNNELIK